MDQSLAISLSSLVMSVLATAVSVIALWRAYLARFSPMTTAGYLTLRICPVRSGDNRWYVVLFDSSLAFANSGPRPGRITGLRLSLHFPEVPIPDNCIRIHATREVDHLKATHDFRDFFAWLDDVSIAHWSPFLLPVGSATNKHFHFQTRWDSPIIQKKCIATLEVLSDRSKRWQAAATWKVMLDKNVWSEFLSHASTFAFTPISFPHVLVESNPKVLPKYISDPDFRPTEGFIDCNSIPDWPDDVRPGHTHASRSA